MYLPKAAPRNRIREAQKARDNRAEIVRALSVGDVTRRDLLRLGILTSFGTLALKNGLSPFAGSAYASSIPTGTPRSPLRGAQKFNQELPRLKQPQKHKLSRVNIGTEEVAMFPSETGERPSKGGSWHNDFLAEPGQHRNPLTGIGPVEGRPPTRWFSHQRWQEYFPQAGYRLSLGPVHSGIRFHPDMDEQHANSVWSFNDGTLGTPGTLPPPLIKVRYGEPVTARIYNSLPLNRADNNGFGRNEASTHNHNAHNGFASDGACNAFFFPGQFYDYHWSTTLARADTVNHDLSELRASGIDDDGRPFAIPGDFRELQGSLWFHDHRFFFTAENVYKGHAGMLNYYSGPDRGNEAMDDGINLRLPSGSRLPWGNVDFDVNLFISDFAVDQYGQLFFDIFDTDGFLGDNMLVNFAYAPFMPVLPRKYRLRLLNACMSRFIKLAFVTESGDAVPVQVIANDGNFLPHPVTVDKLDFQGTGERFDVIIDFSGLRKGDKILVLNTCEHKSGRGPEGAVGLRKAMRSRSDDPAVTSILEFRVDNEVPSVDVPGTINRATDPDRSIVPDTLTEQIEIVEPTRVRELEFKRGETLDGDECFPDCGEKEAFPWQIRIDGESTHFLNANRSSLVVPRPGEVEHWVLKNGGGGWDHPVHIHFEEAVTISREKYRMAKTERHARKDVWRLGEGGSVKIQVRFSEFGGAYVTHCHNTVHEDFAMLLRYDVLKNDNGTGDPLVAISPTPDPRPEGVTFRTPEILLEGDPRNRRS